MPNRGSPESDLAIRFAVNRDPGSPLNGMRPSDVRYHWLRRFGWRVRNPQSLVYAARIIFFGAATKDLPISSVELLYAHR
jgi:hypothetical protein